MICYVGIIIFEFMKINKKLQVKDVMVNYEKVQIANDGKKYNVITKNRHNIK